MSHSQVRAPVIRPGGSIPHWERSGARGWGDEKNDDLPKSMLARRPVQGGTPGDPGGLFQVSSRRVVWRRGHRGERRTAGVAGHWPDWNFPARGAGESRFRAQELGLRTSAGTTRWPHTHADEQSNQNKHSKPGLGVGRRGDASRWVVPNTPPTKLLTSMRARWPGLGHAQMRGGEGERNHSIAARLGHCNVLQSQHPTSAGDGVGDQH